MSDDTNSNQEKGKKRMVQRAIYFEPDMWKQARRKAGLTPLAAIVRKLLKLWLQGKINLDNYED